MKNKESCYTTLKITVENEIFVVQARQHPELQLRQGQDQPGHSGRHEQRQQKYPRRP